MRKSNWAKLKWPRVKETASPAPLWLFCDPFCKSRAQSTCEGELIQKKTQVATIFQCTEAHQTFRSRLWVLTKLVSVSETNPNKKTDTETSNACLAGIPEPKFTIACGKPTVGLSISTETSVGESPLIGDPYEERVCKVEVSKVEVSTMLFTLLSTRWARWRGEGNSQVPQLYCIQLGVQYPKNSKI